MDPKAITERIQLGRSFLTKFGDEESFADRIKKTKTRE